MSSVELIYTKENSRLNSIFSHVNWAKFKHVACTCSHVNNMFICDCFLFIYVETTHGAGNIVYKFTSSQIFDDYTFRAFIRRVFLK